MSCIGVGPTLAPVNQQAKYTMAALLPTIRSLQRIRSPVRRELIQRLTLDVWKTEDCNHFTNILIKYTRPLQADALAD